MDNKERYSRSSRDDRDRDSSADRSPEREATRRHQVRDRDGDSRRRDSDRYRSSSRRYDREEDERDRARDREESRDRDKHHERSKDKEARSKRKEREEESLNREGKKKKSRFEEGSRAMNGASGVEIEGDASYNSTVLETSLGPSQTVLTKMEEVYPQQLGKVVQARLLMC